MADQHDRIADAVAVGKVVWPHFASFAGSILSLSFVERLTTKGKVVAVLAGFLTATFVGPAVKFALAHFAPFIPPEAAAPGLNFLISLCSMAAIPGVLKALQTNAPNLVDALLKKVTPQ